MLVDASVARSFAVVGWTGHLLQLCGGTILVADGVHGITCEPPDNLLHTCNVPSWWQMAYTASLQKIRVSFVGSTGRSSAKQTTPGSVLAERAGHFHPSVVSMSYSRSIQAS